MFVNTGPQSYTSKEEPAAYFFIYVLEKIFNLLASANPVGGRNFLSLRRFGVVLEHDGFLGCVLAKIISRR